MRFENRVVWITGASSGIGEHLAYAFAEEGAQLILSARQVGELERVRDHCRAGTRVLILPLDVTDMEAVAAAVQRVFTEFGYLSILVNNAGISQRSLVADTDLSVDRRIMEVNYFGNIALTKAVLPTLLRQGFGQIVVVSSIMGKIGTPLRSAYAASKHALHGYYNSLRAEVHDHHIGVTILCPGYVRTQVTINALRGDGSALGTMAESTAGGLAPQVFARRALHAIHRRRAEALIGQKEVLAVYVQRFVPALWRWLARRIKTS